jgi:hypothetical protein
MEAPIKKPTSLLNVKNVVIIPYTPPSKKLKRECSTFSDAGHYPDNFERDPMGMRSVEFYSAHRKPESELKIGRSDD